MTEPAAGPASEEVVVDSGEWERLKRVDSAARAFVRAERNAIRVLVEHPDASDTLQSLALALAERARQELYAAIAEGPG